VTLAATAVVAAEVAAAADAAADVAWRAADDETVASICAGVGVDFEVSGPVGVSDG
jgi:hypothetical protein